MVKKCDVCGNEIEEDELGKLKGSIIKKLVNNKNEFKYICSNCQKQGKDKELKNK